jgi:hypothetical protein
METRPRLAAMSRSTGRQFGLDKTGLLMESADGMWPFDSAPFDKLRALRSG